MLHVVKSTGESQPYSEEKLMHSIRRAGVSGDLQDKVITHVKDKIYDDIPTAILYHHVSDFLKHSDKPYMGAKYSLKQSIMELGPTGYPFEDYLARIMQSLGYMTTVRNIIRGKCITHEIDVIATKNQEKMMVEAKFHNFAGTKTNVHVAMYTKARFDDTKMQNGFTKAWLVTNTKITTDAIAYAGCYDMAITSWEYPEHNSFRSIVEEAKLFPITSLLSLNHTQKAQLLVLGTVLVKDITSDPNALASLHLPAHRKEEILSEAHNMLAH